MRPEAESAGASRGRHARRAPVAVTRALQFGSRAQDIPARVGRHARERLREEGCDALGVSS
jgi:hypothetical protein